VAWKNRPLRGYPNRSEQHLTHSCGLSALSSDTASQGLTTARPFQAVFWSGGGAVDLSKDTYAVEGPKLRTWSWRSGAPRFPAVAEVVTLAKLIWMVVALARKRRAARWRTRVSWKRTQPFQWRLDYRL